jgi:hypothetical protein|tara:strand:- start:18 stop:566 length:549 start_codon:yes stop_codon:yes gene_type:complete
MIIAFGGLMSEGVIHYRLSTAKLEQARIAHGLIFGMVFLLALLSLIVIVANKINIKHEIYPHTAHAICGTITLCFLFYQATSGVSKLRWLWKTDEKIYRQHGKCGVYIIYVLGMVTMLLGFYKVEEGWSFYIAAVALVSLLLLVLHTFLRRPRTVVDVYAQIAAEEVASLADIDILDTLDFS